MTLLNKLLILALILSFGRAKLNAQNVSVPDANFKTYLVGNTAINTNGDAEIQVTEALAFSGTMNCSNLGIADLTGVEAFVNLSQLRCYRNNLTSLDLSQNTSLTQVHCYNNQLTSLNLTQNPSLTFVHCVNNSLSNLDLTQNTSLVTFYCSGNSLYNLDLSQNTSLRVLNCNNNQLGHLNVKNGNNVNVTTFSATGNSLSCIEVDDAAYSAANWTSIDAGAVFNISCGSAPVGPFVNIPDPNFKAYLLTNMSVNTNGDTEIQVSEASAFSGSMNCSNLGITDFTGIETFANLLGLDCSFNNGLTNLSFPQNVNLESLYCYSSTLTSLDLTQNTSLETLYCYDNMLTNLDLSQNTSLETVYCYDNQLVSVDVTQSTSLITLICSNNQLSTLDVTQNVLLDTLYFDINNVSNIDLSANGALSYLNCDSNNLNSLYLLFNPLFRASCRNNNLSSLDLRYPSGGTISHFACSGNPNLICIDVNNINYSTNNWVDRDSVTSFSNNCGVTITIPDANFKAYLVGNAAINTNGDTEIQRTEALVFAGTIDCSNLSIADLTGIEEFTSLTELNCNNNTVSSLDLTEITTLTSLSCNNNNLTSLDIENGTNTIITFFDATSNPSLTCINVDVATYSAANWTNVDAGVSFSANCGLPDPVITFPDANFEAYLVGNPLINLNGDTAIQYTEAVAFTGTMDCSNQNISSIQGIDEFENLTGLRCDSNNLIRATIAYNRKLVTLSCTHNNLNGTSIDLITNPDLTSVNYSFNPGITYLDFSQHNLTNIEVESCNLGTLILNNNTNLSTFNATNNPNLSCIIVDDVAYATANWTNIDATTSYSLTCGPVVNIPDANFKAYLVGNSLINTDGDTEIQVTEAANFTGIINCANLNIADLTGIQAFSNITQLSCGLNNLTSLDLSQNSALIDLFCSSNNLMTLNLPSSLLSIDCSNNPLTSLDFSQNTLMAIEVRSCNLTYLNIRNNGTNGNLLNANFDATNNPNLTCIEVSDVAYATANLTNIDATASFSISCGPVVNIPDANFKAYLVGNALINTNGDTEIQVSEATLFGGAINCSNLSITDFTGIEAFIHIDELNCSNNSIVDLDLRLYDRLSIVNVQSCNLSTLDIRNGQNYAIANFNSTNNPNLTCVLVDDPPYSTAYWTADATTTFNINCNPNVVTIPDANFKAYLVGNTAINTNGDAEIQFTEAAAFTGTIDCSGTSTEDLTGVEAFVNLTGIDFSSNYHLFDADLRQNINLVTITGNYCYLLGYLGVPPTSSLTTLICSGNELQGINVSQNPNLLTLDCSWNGLFATLDVSQNPNLVNLNCSQTDITTLDLTQNVNLETLVCSYNGITSIDIRNGNNANMTIFDATFNSNLTCIDVDNAAYSTANWTNIDAGTSFSTNCSAPPAPIVNIPDANFKAYLVGNASINTNGDGEIQVTEATAFTGTISCSSLAIVELTGIEAFVNLTELVCRNNHQLLNIDLSQNTSLVTADCSQNYQLGFINVQGPTLRTLNCSGCEFYGFNVSQATGLEELNCSNNPSIDNLNLSQNTNLERLYCSNTDMSTLDVSQNANLEVLACNFNSITSLDLSQNSNLTSVDCSNNSLSDLDVKNGNNTAITSFDASGNFSLSCINVNDVPYATANWTVGSGTYFSINCSGPAPIVTIPDANFKAYLVGNTAINTNGDTEIQVTEATAFSGTINCPSLNIADVTGVEAFVNLTQLRCNNNNISSIDISQNTSLIQLLCYNNNISSLDLTQNSNLAVLHCVNNPISTLDLTQNTNLTRLFCSGTSISTLDVTQNGVLQRLYCGSNALTSLDLSQNRDLVILDCASNQLASLNIKNGSNTNITSFKAGNNPSLSCIEVDDPAYSTTNWTNVDPGASFNTVCNMAAPIVTIPDANFKAYLVGNSSINANGDTEIQVTEAASFTGRISCSGLNIADLTGVEAFVSLTQLVCYNNNLTSLDVTQNPNLTWIHCVGNSITSLDVTQNPSLSLLYCSNNQISSLDLSQNVNLLKLYAASNQLSSLNVKNGNNTNIGTFQVTSNPSLTCIDVDDVAYSTANWTNIDATASFNINCSGVAPVVTIPDANFKAYLVANAAINTDGDTEIQVTEALAFAGTIDCSNLNVADLTGIEAFENVTILDCSSNQLSSVDLSQNTSLVNLNCSSNQLSILDVSQNTNLTSLDCSSNQLNELDVRNGNNVNITYFDARTNSSLTCIEVDNATYSTTNWTNVDAGTMFSIVCGAPIVTIPDANFKAYLVAHTSINTNGDSEIQVTEAAAFGGRISCQSSNIADLTGIEAFVNLTQLVCYNNNLTSLDVTQNTSLTWIHCVNNSIGSLDVTQNTNLSLLYCSKNQLTTLDLTQNTSLQKLYGATNQFSSLNVKNGNNTNITVFQVTDNANLSCIEVDDVAYSTANWTNIDATASFSTNCAVPMANGNNLNGNNTNNANGAGSEISTSISTINKEMNLSAYPNPTTKNITLDFGKMYKETRIQVTNLTGQTVLSQQLKNVSNTTLELDGAKGIYFVNIQTEEGTATIKVVKK